MAKRWYANLFGTLSDFFYTKKILVNTTDNAIDAAQFGGTVFATSPTDGLSNNQYATTAWVNANGSSSTVLDGDLQPYTVKVGATGFDFVNVSSALASLTNKTCTLGVTIEIQDEVISETAYLAPPNSFTGKVFITSKTVASSLQTQGATVGAPSSGVYQVVIDCINASTLFSVGDWVMLLSPILTTGGATNQRPHRFNGYYRIIAMPNSNQFTIQVRPMGTSLNSPSASNWTAWASTVVAYKLHSRISYNHVGSGFYQGSQKSCLHVYNIGLICSNVSNTGSGVYVEHNSGFGPADIRMVGIAGFYRGTFSDVVSTLVLRGVVVSSRIAAEGVQLNNGMVVSGNSRVFILTPGYSCNGASNYGIYAENNSEVLAWSANFSLPGCATPIAAYNGSVVNFSTSTSVDPETFYGSTGAITPARQTFGNKNSYISD